MTIKLSELEATRKAMTHGEWRLIDERDPENGLRTVSGETVLSTRSVGFENSSLSVEYADIRGIVATHNAADALIEIIWAAYEWQMSPQGPAREARNRLLALLAKVSL